MRSVPPALQRKYDRLKHELAKMGRVLVAFSGGVDSALLLKTARDVLGRNVLAVIATSETYPTREVRAARALARRLAVRTKVIHTEELRNPDFAANAPDRCYHCKRELFSALRGIAEREGLAFVLDGANADDRSDFRPGSRAGRELGVRSPLQKAGLSKTEIRTLSRALGLPTWNKPSLACLASRFPYHTRIEPEGLRRVGRAEEFLRRLGLRQLRVRDHGSVARIEVETGDFAKLLAPRTRVRLTRYFKKLGYTYVTMDLDGYRTGSLNEPLRRRPR
jgi:pyridinium-3,5-biscarboxylic acid mononucleotide sulfurtransferase